VIVYTVPSLALMWYLVIGKKALPLPAGILKPGAKDLYPFLIGFPGLVFTGLAVSLVMMNVPSLPLPPKINAPESAPGWIVMAFSCLGTGYLEESYFRCYLLLKFDDTRIWFRLLASVVLFALCHVYEGPWGILNAALAGCLLAFLFERYKSLHGIALAHGADNAFVYLTANFI
jgi:membrane protease YdiL (CAAX protease family)